MALDGAGGYKLVWSSNPITLAFTKKALIYVKHGACTIDIPSTGHPDANDFLLSNRGIDRITVDGTIALYNVSGAEVYILEYS